MPGGLFRASGAPLSDGTWTYTWRNGRQLGVMSKSGTYARFMYNENGLRVKKIIQPSEYDTANAVETNYTLHGKNIVHMTQGSNELHFFYDAQNKPAVVVFNGTPYSYVKNLQGDIVAILDDNGTAVVQYKYDAWGKQISKTGTLASTLGTIQPFRYRGYVYDEETEVYYLRTRYYTAYWGRFFNIDNALCGIKRPLANNMLSYCHNTPVNTADDNGMDAYWLTDVDSVAGAGHTSLLVEDEASGQWYYFYWGSANHTASGAAEVLVVAIMPPMNSEGNLDLTSLNSALNTTPLSASNPTMPIYAGSYEVATLLTGDYSETVDSMRAIQNGKTVNGREYNLLTTNCMQVSAKVLSDSCYWLQSLGYAYLATKVIPNKAGLDLAQALPLQTVCVFSSYDVEANPIAPIVNSFILVLDVAEEMH